MLHIKNTAPTKVIFTCLALVALAGCNSTNVKLDGGQTAQVSEQITLKAQQVDDFTVTSSSANAVFNNSETLTDVMNEKLAAAGISQSGGATIKIEGEYTAQGRVGNIKVDLGELIERNYQDADPKALEDRLSNSDRPRHTSITGGKLTPMGANLTGSLSGGLLVDTVFNSLINLTGISGGFNKALTGDPRGVCLFNCSNWNKVTQAVLITASLEEPGKSPVKMRVMTRAFEEELMPGKMVDAALDHIVKEASHK